MEQPVLQEVLPANVSDVTEATALEVSDKVYSRSDASVTRRGRSTRRCPPSLHREGGGI